MNVNLSLQSWLSQSACNWDASFVKFCLFTQFMCKYLKVHFQYDMAKSFY